MDEANPGWFQEYITPDLYHMLAIQRRVYSSRTRFQAVEILDTVPFGRCLILDGKTQSAEADEFIYHEALVQPAMVTHPNPTTVFIAGGGEGATLREALSHNTVKRVVMVDLDREVVEICRRFLPNHHRGAFEDPRVELHHSDAGAFLKANPDTYDVMLVDLPDPMEGGPAASLYTQSFYRLLRQRLNPGGVMAVQSEPCMAGNLEAFTAINTTLQSVFPGVFPYHAMVPSFSSDWGFNLASLGPNPLELEPKEVDRRLAARGCSSLGFYDGETHRGLFILPRHIRKALTEETRVITEDSPLVVF
ncbi:MAG: Polyamine aminopropyltransferase [Dehalococcoidia bacterium]|nr:Polyamine aminopropyltransferase [Dehalococcoidia bacterium]